MKPFVSPIMAIEAENLLLTYEQASLTRRLFHSIGYLPDEPPTGRLKHVLDLGCGSGAWTNGFASTHPGSKVLGLDACQTLLTQARSNAHVQAISNVDYHLAADRSGPFALPDASFEVIHVQQPLLPSYRWAGFLEECFRLLRPGGMLCLVAWEQPMTNAPAWERFSHLTLTALARAGYSRSHGERHAGLLCDLEPLCYAAGFRHSVLSARWINFSYFTPLHKEWAHPLLHSSAARSLILQTGLATREELNTLCRRQRMEMEIPNFHAVLPLLILWCIKAA